MSLSQLLFGNKDQFKKASTLSEPQGNFLNSLFELLGGGSLGRNFGAAQDYLGNMISGSSDAYQRFAAPFRTEFEQQTIPRLAQRFAGLGGAHGGGALGSTGFAQALGGAGSQFQSNLANLYAQLQQNAANQALNQYGQYSNLGLGTRAFENLYQPGSTGVLGGALSGIGQGLGSGLGMGLGSKFMGMFGGGSTIPSQQGIPSAFAQNFGV